MLEVISPGLKRQLNIIQYLYKRKGEVHRTAKLAELNNVSERTIRVDINHININFPSLHIHLHSKGYIELRYPDHIGIGYVYRRIMYLSLEIDIFECLLNKPKQPKKYYLKKFYISESLFRRIIHRWNQYFERRKLNISITLSPVVSVNGEEITIRRLYYHFLLEKYLGDFQNSFPKRYTSIWELINRIESLFSVELSYSSHHKLLYWFFVCIQRIKYGHSLKEEHTESSKNIVQLLFNKINNDIVLKEQFSYDNHLNLSMKNLLDIVGVYELELLTAKHITKDPSSYEAKEKGLSMIAIRNFLNSFYDSIHYENPLFEETLAFLYIFLTWQYKVSYFLHNYHEQFREYLQKENPFFLEMFEKHLENSTLPSYLKENNDLKNEFLYHVVIHTQALLENLSQVGLQKKKILILTKSHKSFMYSMKNKLENILGEGVSISIYRSNEPQISPDSLKQFDIILTDFDYISKELDNRTVYLDIGMSEEFIDKIKRKIKYL